MKQIPFYALRQDILSVLEHVEQEESVQYIRTGNALHQEFETFSSGKLIPNIGTASSDTGLGCDSFLVATTSTRVAIRSLIGNDGQLRYCMDQVVNPDAIVFTPAGLGRDGVVLSGRVATASGSLISQELMKRFDRAFNKGSAKVKAYRVGPAALEVLRNGGRLAISVQSPREYDLSLSV